MCINNYKLTVQFIQCLHCWNSNFYIISISNCGFSSFPLCVYILFFLLFTYKYVVLQIHQFFFLFKNRHSYLITEKTLYTHWFKFKTPQINEKMIGKYTWTNKTNNEKNDILESSQFEYEMNKLCKNFH